MVGLCEREVAGTFNATNAGVPWGELLDTCRNVSGSDARVVWVTDDFLVGKGVGEWMELPLWLADPAMSAADEAVIERALEAGLRFRPLEDTIRGALDHAATTEAAGLTPEREAALIADWHGNG